MLADLLKALGAFADLPLGLQMPFIAMFAGLLGSFINVCIWRIPRGESIVFPRSHCPNCQAILGVPDLVPVLSYLFLRGRCRHCGTPFSPRYMFVELLVIAAWCASLAGFGLSLQFLVAGILSSVLIASAGVMLMSRSLRRNRAGFTFIDILLAMTLLAIFVGPFLDITRTGFLGAAKNREYLLAHNLARERIEELRVVPVQELKSDWEVYAHGERLTDNIFVDEFGPLAKWGQSEQVFYENFSDVMTERNLLPETVQEKFEKAYKRYYGCDYAVYSPEYSFLRRFTKVKDVSDPSVPGMTMVQATVSVIINSKITKNRLIEVSAIFSDRGQ